MKIYSILSGRTATLIINQEQLTGMAISGTPGIGKSVFLFYILWRLANMETYKDGGSSSTGDEGRIYVFQNDGCWITMNRKSH